MIIIPAIDLLGGNCVRLVRGEYESAHKVAADPFETSEFFVSCGAEYIHIVDLDGAKKGESVNGKIICDLIKKSKIPCEIGGGIRSAETVKFYIENGAGRVILGSAALENPELVRQCVNLYGDKISVGIDARGGYVSTSGWLKTSEVYFTGFAGKMAESGVSNIIFTDISRDGTLSGPPMELLKQLKDAVPDVNITASGGICGMDDIKKLNGLDIYGAIAGKSVYSGTLDLKSAVEYCRRNGRQNI